MRFSSAIWVAVLMSVGVVGLTNPATAATFFGAEAGGANLKSAVSGGGIGTSPITFYGDGGEGDTFASINANDGRGDVQAESDLFGNGIIPTVKVKTVAQHGGGHNGVASADAGALQTYVYTGPLGTLTFNYSITATLVEAPSTTAILSASGGLVTDLTQFTTNIDEVEGEEIIGTKEDEFSGSWVDAQVVNVNGSMTMTDIDNGDVFSLILRTSAWAGNAGASVDAFSTVGGSFVLPAGGSLQIIPEPASLALLGLGGIAALRRRR